MSLRAATRGLALALALVASACSDDHDDKGLPVVPDGGELPPPDGDVDASVPSLDGSIGADGSVGPDGSVAPDASADASVRPALTSCLDRPDELSRPPAAELPCELLPPGLSLPR